MRPYAAALRPAAAPRRACHAAGRCLAACCAMLAVPLG